MFTSSLFDWSCTWGSTNSTLVVEVVDVAFLHNFLFLLWFFRFHCVHCKWSRFFFFFNKAIITYKKKPVNAKYVVGSIHLLMNEIMRSVKFLGLLRSIQYRWNRWEDKGITGVSKFVRRRGCACCWSKYLMSALSLEKLGSFTI